MKNQLEECFHEFHFLDINLKSFLIQEIQEMIEPIMNNNPEVGTLGHILVSAQPSKRNDESKRR